MEKIIKEKYEDFKNLICREKVNFKLYWNQNLIERIIENENSSIVYKRKIIDEILSVKNNDNYYQINYLKIVLFGRKGVGKTTLIKYMLNLDEQSINNKDLSKNFYEYENIKVPYLKLVEFKRAGHDKNYNPRKDYIDFFNCIWYCVSGTKLDKSEKKFLLKLSQNYNDKTIPIIIVYTQNINNIDSDAMKKYIEDIGLKTSFIKVLAKDINLNFGGNIIEAYGKNELLNETLKKCIFALQGNMINMIDAISYDIRTKILTKNKSIEEMINYNIINNFTNEYKSLLNDEEFKNYITGMIGNNLFPFYENYNKKITNKSLNLLKKSNIINSVDNFFQICKSKVFQIIDENLNEKAQILLDKQAAIEKNAVNIRLKNKRYLKGFEKSIITFIKRNFYYISQKIIINYIIKTFCRKFIMKYREKLDNLVKSYLKKENRNNEINDYLKECFLSKLENFSKKNQIDIKIIHPHLTDTFKEIEDEENFDKGNENRNSILIFDDFDYGQENQIKNMKIESGHHWFPFNQNKFKYLNDKSLSLLKDFMQNKMELQDINFKNGNSDKVFEALKNYELNNLINFFYSQKNIFINEINDTYKGKNIKIDDIYLIKNIILSSKQFQ